MVRMKDGGAQKKLDVCVIRVVAKQFHKRNPVAATCNLTRSLISIQYQNLPAVVQAVCVSWGHVDDMTTPTQDKAQ